MPSSVRNAPITFHANQPLPPLSRFAVRAVLVLVKWDLRHRTRRDLSRLSPHLMDDIGLELQMAEIEIEKPFWRG